MKELLWSRKWGFIQYVAACFLPVVMDLLMQGVFVMIFVVMERQEMKYFYMTLGLSIVAVGGSWGLYILGRFMRIGFMRDILLDIRKKAFDKILATRYKTFSKQSKEVYISHLINDINTFEKDFFFNLVNVIYLIGRYLTSAIIILVLDLQMGLMMLIVSGVMFGVGRLFGNQTNRRQIEVAQANEQFTTEIGNTFNGLEILKLSGVEERFLDKNLHRINKVENRKMALSVYSELQRSLMWSIEYGVIALLIINVMRNIMNGGSLGEQMLVFQMSQSMLYPLVDGIPKFNVIKASVRIYDKITQSDEEIEDEQERTVAFDFNNQMTVTGLNFAYEGKEILKDASFTIEKGKKYLIKGVSGAGKSTLLKLLSMIYEDYEGCIEVDGVNYKKVSEKSFNDQVSFVYQDVFLFEDTLANNISLYKDLSQVQIEAAARLAGLETFIESQPNGLDTKISENGKNLSGGQRQRISIARAIAKEASILFVDEGTSALNEQIGKQIEQELLNLECTVIAISHRYYEGVSNQYDYVLEVKNGRVTAYAGADYFEEVEVC